MTLKPIVERYTKSMSLKYEPTSEPLHIVVVLTQSIYNQLFKYAKQMIEGQEHEKARVPAAFGGQDISIPLGFLGGGATT